MEEKQTNKIKKLRTVLGSTTYYSIKEKIKKDDCNIKDFQGNLYLLEKNARGTLSFLKTIIIENSLEKYASDTGLEDEIKTYLVYIGKLNRIYRIKMN